MSPAWADTFRIIFATGAPESGDLRGSTFSVEGLIYPENTIEGDRFDPTSAGAIGRWMCCGWFLINPDRPEPHVLTTQEYILRDIRANRLYPPNQLVSSGTEGSDAENQAPIRSVIGGTGKYLGAKGEVFQHGRGKNTTTLATLELPAAQFPVRVQARLAATTIHSPRVKSRESYETRGVGSARAKPPKR